MFATRLMAGLCCLLLAGAGLASMEGDSSALSAPYSTWEAGHSSCGVQELSGHFERHHAAMNLAMSPDACGACVRVWATEEGPSNATAAHIVKVVDDCLACQYSDIELSPEAFLAVTGSTDGLTPVAWDFVPCHEPSLTPTTLSTATLNDTDPRVTGSARRMLLRSGGKKKRPAEVSEEVVFADWVVPCQEGRLRCPNLYLASQGYQCMTWNSENCCLKANGRYCTPLEWWAHAATPAAWLGREMVHGSSSADSSQDAAADVSANPDTDSAAAAAAAEEEKDEADSGDSTDNGDNTDSTGSTDSTDNSPTPAGPADSAPADPASPQPAPQDGSVLPAAPAPAPAAAVEEPPVPSPGPKADSTSTSGSWRRATSTFYNSYPDCCTSRKANQGECRYYNGCQWQGLFAAFNKKMSKEWVASNNIVAFYASPNSQNRKEWRRKWMNKRLRLRNPTTGNTLDVQVVDTCDDSDCSGCCSKNANRNGGFLIDLEYHTAKRFWGARINGMAVIEWQEI